MAGCVAFCLGLVWSGAGVAEPFPEFGSNAGREYLLAVSSRAFSEAGTNAETCLAVARVQSDLGRTDEAERWARQAIQLNARSADAQVLLARLFIRQDRMKEAVVCLRAALQLEEGSAATWRLLGMALEREGDMRGAEEALETLLRRSPADAEAGFLLGRLLLDQDRTREAIARLEVACRSDPASASGFYLLHQAQTRTGQTEAAQRSLQTFQELKRQERTRIGAMESEQSDERKLRESAADFHNQVAVALLRGGMVTNAEAHLRQAIRVCPEQPLAYERLAALCLKAGRLRAAEELFAGLVRLRPDDPGYGVNRGTLLLQLRDYPSAIREFERVLRAHPEQPEALNNLARLYLSTRQQLPEALVLARRLVDGQPTAERYDLLGWALYLNGKTNDALEACKEAVRREPGNPAFQERQRRLEQVLRVGR